MRVLLYFILLLTAAPVLTGCGAPDPQFVYNKKTDELVPEVSKAVKALVDENFGTPNQPIAWLRLPVDYGTIRGKVTGIVEDKKGSYRLEVKFADKTSESFDLDDVHFPGLALRWTSGAYAGGMQKLGKGKDDEVQRLYSLGVAAYDRETSILTLRQRLQTPPAMGENGDTFEIIGHKLAAGRQLYATHCQHCHGTSGDGNGPTAQYLKPLPRDYRQGIFKFKSTRKLDKPTDDDLERIIRKGIPGTYMPSFLLLEDRELAAITSYVKWLSMRGEYELKLVNMLYSSFEKDVFDETVKSELELKLEGYDPDSDDEKPTTASIRAQLLAEEGTEFIDLPEISETESVYLAQSWGKVNVIAPSVARTPDTPRSRAKGRVIFLQKCAACHGSTGRGDGEQVDTYMIDENRVRYPEPGLFDDWGKPIKPRDLTRGIYRGGRRPVDLYRRVYEGINGTPMPRFGGAIPDADIWDLVNYVYHIPFDRQQPAADEVHGKGKTASVEHAIK